MTCIGICHYKIGDTDGVSLEIDKWEQVLKRMGHEVILCGGDLGTRDGVLIDEMYHHRRDAKQLSTNAFQRLEDYGSGEAWKQKVFELAAQIETQFGHFVKDHNIAFLIPNNIWSLGANLSAAVALAGIVHRLDLPAIGHHHDFYWERFRRMRPTCKEAEEIAENYLPPTDPRIQHVVINSLARDELKRRSGVGSTVVPNVFDFEGSPWGIDAYNQSFRETIEVGENDLLVLQATRVIPRKGIELAIDLVKALSQQEHRSTLTRRGLYDGRPFTEKSRIVLVLAGSAEDSHCDYFDRLKRKAEQQGIELRCISARIRAHRETVEGQKLYSLWDCYAFADVVTYPSLYEGWGNQFLEAVRAKLPIVIFEYPVYRSDIKNKGFKVISLGSHIVEEDDCGLVSVSAQTIREAAQRAVEVVTNPAKRRAMTEHNFELGRVSYGLDSLVRCLGPIIERTLSRRG